VGRRVIGAGRNVSLAEAGATGGSVSTRPTSRLGLAARPLKAVAALPALGGDDDDMMKLARAIYDLFPDARRGRLEKEYAAATAAAA